jgi:P-type E1-E2 ATPase
MGGANEICTDKTGTLTTGKMTLIECWINGQTYKAGNALESTTEA